MSYPVPPARPRGVSFFKSCRSVRMPVSYASARQRVWTSLFRASAQVCFHGAFESELLHFIRAKARMSTRNPRNVQGFQELGGHPQKSGSPARCRRGGRGFRPRNPTRAEAQADISRVRCCSSLLFASDGACGTPARRTPNAQAPGCARLDRCRTCPRTRNRTA